jgi:DNA invertase Pin-like site-specific DNA recombinase/peptidoglycan hydrolase-like protein with peptidoglycan-binding domain
MYRRWPLAALAAALTLLTAPAAFAAGESPPAAAGWHGREIRDPLPQRLRAAIARFPRGWSAGGVGLGSGYASRTGSRRVREVQRRLLRRGYRPGRVDGRFGPRTRAAVLWFETKHGLARSGRIDARGVATLRRAAPARPPATATAPTAPSRAHRAAGPSPERADRTWLVLVAAMLIAALAALAWRRRAARRRAGVAATGAGERRAQLTAVTAPAHAPVGVIGYLALARGADRDRDRAIDTATRSIGPWCEDRGWQLTQIVHDVAPASGRITDRPGLAYALDEIAAGRIAGLVLAHLSDLTRSVTELAQLLHWLNRAGAFMIALDYELDTSTAAGELTAGALMEIGDWQRGLLADRTRAGLTAIRTQAAANRTSVRDNPQLSARIRTMRAQGMSLQAISDTLNREGVPTLRGGTHWRPSSVQAAAGYKRPPTSHEFPPLTRANGANTQGRWDKEPN